MKKYNIGFIGCGKMAGAIIRGIIKSGFVSAENVLASKSSVQNLEEISKNLGIEITLDNKRLASFADIIFIAVKPNQISDVLDEIKDFVNGEKLIVSVAAGVTTSFIESKFSSETRVIRVMPNTPVLLGEGMSGICSGKFAKSSDVEFVQELFNTVGKSVVVEESQIDIVTAISGSGPAFFYKVIEEIARSGERLGLDYEKSLLLSVQTALGSAKMAMNRTISMEELISNVATKGGCTRVGVDCMDEKHSGELFYEVIKSTAKKANELGK